MLAYAPEQAQSAMLAESLEAETEQSVIDPQTVLDRLPLIRERFYDYAAGEMLLGINTIAVPIFRDNDILAGAIGIVGSIQEIPDPPPAAQIDLLRQYADELSVQLKSNAYRQLRLAQ
jgi:DNA-binding IclR family transcriptional regulator